MGKIKTDNHDGEDRRKGKLQLSTMEWFRIACVIVPLIVAGAVCYANATSEMDSLEKSDIRQDRAITHVNDKMETEFREFRIEQTAMSNAVARIEGALGTK